MALCFVGLASQELRSFSNPTSPGFGRIPSLPHLNFGILLDMEFEKSTGLGNCVGNHWIKLFRALDEETGNHWIKKLVWEH